MKKKFDLKRQFVLSFVASSMIYSQVFALPQGGKFINNTQGTISTVDKTMNIQGQSGKNVIAWGGDLI